jgi:hypothetical protein
MFLTCCLLAFESLSADSASALIFPNLKSKIEQDSGLAMSARVVL